MRGEQSIRTGKLQRNQPCCLIVRRPPLVRQKTNKKEHLKCGVDNFTPIPPGRDCVECSVVKASWEKRITALIKLNQPCDEETNCAPTFGHVSQLAMYTAIWKLQENKINSNGTNAKNFHECLRSTEKLLWCACCVKYKINATTGPFLVFSRFLCWGIQFLSYWKCLLERFLFMCLSLRMLFQVGGRGGAWRSDTHRYSTATI